MPTPTFTQITPHIFKLDLPMAGGRIMVGVWLVRADAALLYPVVDDVPVLLIDEAIPLGQI